MKKHLALTSVILLMGSLAQASVTPESLRFGAGQSFSGAFTAATVIGITPIKLTGTAIKPQSTEPTEPVLQDPKPTPVEFNAMLAEVGRMNLAKFLDGHRDLFNLRLGAKDWDVSIAGDAAFKTYFLTFARGETLIIRPLGDLNELRGKGINVRIDESTAYNFKVSINIFNPVRGSTLKITPIQGTRGPKHKIKTGVLLDRVKAKSYVFKSGKEYWTLYGRDVDPKTNTLTDTKSFLTINEAGMNTKAWPLAESALKLDQPTEVDFNGAKFVLTRTKDELIINR